MTQRATINIDYKFTVAVLKPEYNLNLGRSDDSVMFNAFQTLE